MISASGASLQPHGFPRGPPPGQDPGRAFRPGHRSCEEIAESNPAFAGTKFTPHDFRRLFATEIVNGGLPIDIGAALLGHLNLQTTQGYVAVFAEDIVKHYQEFLNHRRALRPEHACGDVAPEEWVEFEEHFDKRKVELGNCARPYGSPCQHEHACIRCPVLRVNPKMLTRLAEFEQDLLQRLRRAETEGWLGEDRRHQHDPDLPPDQAGRRRSNGPATGGSGAPSAPHPMSH
ncbi:site-specific integrase [Streptomyces sp. TRM68367]|uniref:site-specific integrase n=1 Tax=Streptomyces sp. TRM68367 TaxID=2758415 RepID=UPI0021CFB97D|nr:site-specific integrase [Streptomyces sp. TRM68367]